MFGEKGTGRAVGMSRNMMFVVVICKLLRWMARYLDAANGVLGGRVGSARGPWLVVFSAVCGSRSR